MAIVTTTVLLFNTLSLVLNFKNGLDDIVKLLSSTALWKFNDNMTMFLKQSKTLFSILILIV